MPAERQLPIAESHREFTVRVDTQPVGRQNHLLSVSIRAQAGRIAVARLTYLDGSASASDFTLSAGDSFVPGKAIEILASDGPRADLLFKGVITGQAFRVRENGPPQLVVECRHAAFKLAVVPRSAHRFDVTDSEAIEAMLKDAGVEAEVEATTVKHAQLVQAHCSDWDFIVARAHANGLRVFTRAGQLAVRKPSTDAKPLATLTYGASILAFDAEIDARTQFAGIESRAWQADDQQLATSEAVASSLRAPGNFDPESLARVAGATLRLDHSAADSAETQAWADARRRDAALAQLRGRVSCIGLGQVLPGDVVQLAGLGARVNGTVPVTGVRHEFDTVQGWRTHLQFGDDGLDDATVQRLSQHPAAHLVAPVQGLQIGVVTSNEDPAGEHRVRVRLPLMDPSGDGLWARVAAPDAGKERGFFFRPEINDEVVVGFLDDDPRHPILLGMLHGSAHPAPLAGKDTNHEKAYVSRTGMKLHFDDEKKVLTLSTPAGHSLVMSEDDQSIVLADQNGNRIKLGSEGIEIESASKLSIKAGQDAQIEAGANLSAEAATQLELSAGSGATLKSAATTSVQGSVVKIN